MELSTRAPRKGRDRGRGRFGGGWPLVRNGGASGKARRKESARYWLEFMGAPSSVTSRARRSGTAITCRPITRTGGEATRRELHERRGWDRDGHLHPRHRAELGSSALQRDTTRSSSPTSAPAGTPRGPTDGCGPRISGRSARHDACGLISLPSMTVRRPTTATSGRTTSASSPQGRFGDRRHFDANAHPARRPDPLHAVEPGRRPRKLPWKRRSTCWGPPRCRPGHRVYRSRTSRTGPGLLDGDRCELDATGLAPDRRTTTA